MTYYLIPKTNQNIYKNLECIENKSINQPVISYSLSHYLYEIKKKIEEKGSDWDMFKKYTNPYEFVHSNIPNKKKSISKYKPLSRSYFKMLEILNVFKFSFAEKINTFHLAEGPGGFIEAISNFRKNNNDFYVGMSLLDDKNDPNIPSWKKSDAFLKQNPNVYIEKGKDNTGDILALNNFLSCKEKYMSSVDFITADGGFDFSVDFYGKAGGYSLSYNTRDMLDPSNIGDNMAVEAFNYWKKPGDVNVQPAAKYTDASETSTRYLYKTDYIRLRNLNFGYTIPTSIIEPVGLDNVRVYMTGQNLWTYAPHYVGLDPEVGVGVGESSDGEFGTFSIFGLPILKSLQFGIDIKF